MDNNFVEKVLFDKHLWGGELKLIATELYTAKLICLKKGFQSSLHCHHKKDETFFVLFGQVSLEVNTKEFIMNPGDSIRLKPNDVHRFKATQNKAVGKGEFLKEIMNYLKVPREIKLGVITNMYDAVILEASTYDDPKDNIKIKLARRI
jgi:quercetin dioxygenase-like cupin family protein